MKRFLGIFVLILLLVASCGGKKEVKKESEEAKIAKDAFTVVESLKNAYSSKDLSAVERNTTKEGFSLVVKDIRKFDIVELQFKPVWVQIEPDRVIMNISWQGKWQKGAVSSDEKGMAVFILKDKPMKVDQILRSNPFEYPD